jgi:hypothetical protein
MREIVAASPDELDFLCTQIGYTPTKDITGIALHVDGAPKLIVGYDQWTDNAVTMHQWAEHPRYYGRGMIREAFRYPFEMANRGMVFGVVRSDNAHTLAVNAKLGFQTAAILPDVYGPGIHAHVFRLRRGECRWYKS